MIVLQQLKLSIEESHNTNDGYAKGGGEKHFVEHIFLLVSDLGLGQTIMICWCCLQASKGVKTGRLNSCCLLLQCSPLQHGGADFSKIPRPLYGLTDINGISKPTEP